MVTNKNEKNKNRSIVAQGLKLVKYDNERNLIFAEKTFRELVEADPRLAGLERSFRMFMEGPLLERHSNAILEIRKDMKKTQQKNRLKLTQ